MKNDEVWFGNNGCSVLSSCQNKVINYNTFYFQTTKLHMSKKEDITMTWHLVGLNYLKTRVWSEWRVENDMHLSCEYCSKKGMLGSRLCIVMKSRKFCWNMRQLCMSRFESNIDLSKVRAYPIFRESKFFSKKEADTWVCTCKCEMVPKLSNSPKESLEESRREGFCASGCWGYGTVGAA